MKVRRAREETNFTTLSNSFIDDRRLSVLACGLGVIFLRMPPEAVISLQSIADHRKEGIKALRAAARELEDAGYLIRTVERGAGGQLVTFCEMHSRPVPEDERPESLPKPWSKARSRQQPAGESDGGNGSTSTGDGDVSTGHTESPSRKVGTGNFGVGNIGTPTVGTAAFIDKDFGDKDFPDNPPSSVPDAPDDVEHREQGEGEVDERKARAGKLVDSLPYGRTPSKSQRATLVRKVTAALAAGHTEEGLRAHLTAETDSAQSLYAIYRHRLKADELPNPNRSAAAPSGPSSEGRVWPEWCGQCREETRWIEPFDPRAAPHRCPACHPREVAA